VSFVAPLQAENCHRTLRRVEFTWARNSLGFRFRVILTQNRYLAIDIGGTNLRVGFVELLGQHDVNSQGDNFQFENGGIEKEPSRVNQTHKSWPIGEKLKNEKAEDLFAWIGECIADVIEEDLPGSPELWVDEHPMGVTFSFPMM
jgi:hexokinase